MRTGLHALLFVAAGALAVAAAAQSDRMRVVDPLGGAWRATAIGDLVVPPGQEATVAFNDGAWFSTQAGCGNFGRRYSLASDRLHVRPRDALVLTKCPSRQAARFETALARHLAQAARYELGAEGQLRIVGRDGRAMTLRRPEPTIPALAGRWIVEAIGPDRLDPKRRARLWFGPGWLTAAADCNQLSAAYRAVPGGLATEGGAATQMGCGREREAFDARLFAALGKVRRFQRLPGGRMRLDGGEPLLLARPAPADMRLEGRYRVCGNNPPHVTWDGVATLEFARGTVRDSAGCTASYAASGALLNVRRASTQACAVPPTSLNAAADISVGDRGSVLASLRPDAYAFREDGVLRLRTARGVLDMCREGEPLPFGRG